MLYLSKCHARLEHASVRNVDKRVLLIHRNIQYTAFGYVVMLAVGYE